jgi:hypothetical protein
VGRVHNVSRNFGDRQLDRPIGATMKAALLTLLVLWGIIVFVSSIAIAQLFGSAAQMLFMLPVFIISLIGGLWFGSRMAR